MPGLFAGPWYNGAPQKDFGFIESRESLRISIPRLRQQRVKKSKFNYVFIVLFLPIDRFINCLCVCLCACLCVCLFVCYFALVIALMDGYFFYLSVMST